MSGQIEMRHRYGGHGGIATEWEIRVFTPKCRKVREVICALPRFQWVNVYVADLCAMLDLPQRTSRKEAVRCCSLLRDGQRNEVEVLLQTLEDRGKP